MQALATARLQSQDLASVEVVGSSSRVPALIAILKEVLGQDPSRTMNAKECVSRGCALNCAMLSPIFRSAAVLLIVSRPDHSRECTVRLEVTVPAHASILAESMCCQMTRCWHLWFWSSLIGALLLAVANAPGTVSRLIPAG